MLCLAGIRKVIEHQELQLVWYQKLLQAEAGRRRSVSQAVPKAVIWGADQPRHRRRRQRSRACHVAALQAEGGDVHAYRWGRFAGIGAVAKEGTEQAVRAPNMPCGHHRAVLATEHDQDESCRWNC